jgi:transposase
MTITTVGIDLAKNVFAVHCVDQNGKTVLVKSSNPRSSSRADCWFTALCYRDGGMLRGSYWARLFRQYGHEPRLMAAKFVSPYRMAGKSGKMMQLMLRLSAKQFVAHICGLYQLRMRASRRCSVSYPTGFYRRENSNI